MPRIKKPRKKGTTYKLVPRSYGDGNGEDEGPLWVSEAEFYRQQQSVAAPQADENTARRQLNMYAVAANAEFNEERRRGRCTEGDDGAAGVYDDYEENAEEGEFEDGFYDDYGGEGEGEWIEGDWEEEEEGEEVTQLEEPPQKLKTLPSSAPPPALVSSGSSTTAVSPSDRAVGEVEEQEERLFDDEVECEVTDDFLRQLVFGCGDVGDHDERGSDVVTDGDDSDAFDDGDAELWRLLTEEEKAAIKASRRRGTARRRHVATAANGEERGLSRTHAADGTIYPVHDTTQRALDRQFTEMMREFDADERLNDAYTDDPRTHGALPVDNYLTALEEFVAGRAGVDVETAEPHKNKGLIHQLKYLSHHVGAFDSDARGVYMTTILPEKQQRFVEEYQKGTEEIRRAARMRALRRDAALHANADARVSDPSTAPVLSSLEDSESAEEEEELVVMELKSKADRLDCETAASAYSTYYNQPNVIHAPRRTGQSRRIKHHNVMARREGTSVETDARSTSRHPESGTAMASTTAVKGNIITAGAAPSTNSVTTTAAATHSSSARKGAGFVQVREPTSDTDSERGASVNGARGDGHVLLTVRHKDETKEEKKMRRQAVKSAQRERRQAKSALKHTYKEVEAEELKRSSTSQAARRTVHFM